MASLSTEVPMGGMSLGNLASIERIEPGLETQARNHNPPAHEVVRENRHLLSGLFPPDQTAKIRLAQTRPVRCLPHVPGTPGRPQTALRKRQPVFPFQLSGRHDNLN